MADKLKLPRFNWRDKCPPLTHEEALENWDKMKKDSADKFCRERLTDSKLQDAVNLQSIRSRSGIPSKYLSKNFDDYITTNDNQRRAYDICKKYATDFEGKLKSGSSLVLAGGTSTGKTHLACAIANHVIVNYAIPRYIVGNKAKVIYSTFAEMIGKIKSPWETKGISQQKIYSEFSDGLLLVIDEVGIQFKTDFEKDALLRIIDKRSTNSLPTIMMSNHSMADVKDFFGDRLVARIRRTGGGFLPFEWDSYKPNKTIDNFGG